MSEYKIIEVLKGGSFSSTNVVEDSNGKKRVRKFISQKEDREYGLVRWQSQIRRMQCLNQILPNNTPNIIEMGTTDTDFYYDIKYYENSCNLFEYLCKNDGNDIFEKVFKLIDCYSDISYGHIKGSFSVFFTEEILQKIEIAKMAILDKYELNIFSNNELSYINSKIDAGMRSSLDILESLKKMDIQESLTHGNLTLENMIFDSTSETIILIDPYSETYCESILGDYSQLMQSAVSHYELINNMGETFIKNIEASNQLEVPKGLESFGTSLKEKLSYLDSKNTLILNLFHAGQFIRMFPFKIDKTPRMAAYFLLHGLNLMMDSLDNA